LRLEAGERELLNERFERHAVLEPDRDRHREAIHERTESRTLFVHIDEDLAERAIEVLAGPEEDLVAPDARLLGPPGSLLGQAHAHPVRSHDDGRTRRTLTTSPLRIDLENNGVAIPILPRALAGRRRAERL